MAGNMVEKGHPLWIRGNLNRTPVEELLADHAGRMNGLKMEEEAAKGR